MPDNSLVPCCSPKVGVTPDGELKVAATISVGIPSAVAWGTDSVSTAVSGTGFTALPSHTASEVMIVNPTVAIDVRRVGDTAFVTMAIGSGLSLSVVANSNEVEVRRNDVSVTPVAVKFVFED